MDTCDETTAKHATDITWQCTWRTGPDAGATHQLPGGLHLVGRAHTADVRCDDPALQPHHALVEVRPDGSLLLTQLTGRAPILLDGCAMSTPATVGDGSVVELGASSIECRQVPIQHSSQRAHIVEGALIRTPRALPEWQPGNPVPPPAPTDTNSSAAGLVPALLGLAGAGAIAVVMQQPMFLLFGALGGLVALGSWGAQRIGSRRARKRDAATFAAAQATYLADVLRDRELFRQFHLATVPTVATAFATITTTTTALWSRRGGHVDAFVAALGRGDIAWPDAAHETGELADREARDLPIAAELGGGARLAVRGPQGLAVARSLLMQLASSCGPADLRMVVVTDRPAHWDCIRSLPHLGLPDGSVAVISEPELTALLADLGEHHAHLLFVTDQPSLLATRTSPLRRALADPDLHALIVVLHADAGVPHLCTSVVTTGAGSSGRWVADTHATMLPVPVRCAGLSERSAFTCAAALRGLIDPEDPLSVATGMPRDISLATLLATEGGTSLTPAGIVATWVAAGADPSPRTLIGIAADGVVDIDLVRDGPHGLIAGTTGAGKSELLRSMVAGMAAGASPAHLCFVLVDYKGGATFDACAALPHVVGVITDLDDHLADRALRSLHAELRRREGILRDHGAADLTTLRTVAPDVLLPRLVVVIDEFAALVAEQPNFLHALVGVAQRGRSLGVHLLLATQRPNGVISDDIRANTNLRVALRLQDTADANDVVGVPSPAMLPRGLPGRAVMRLGADDHLTFQTARCTTTLPGGTETELHVLVRSICEAARLAGSPRPPAPWQPALATNLTRDHVPADAIGLIDDPDQQQISLLRWAPAEGHLLIAGSPGAGATSALCTLAAASTAEMYVIDGRGSDRLGELAAHPLCVAVVRLHERERMMRLLFRLRTMMRARTVGGVHEATVLFIDGIDALRRTLDDLDTAAEFDALEEILADGEAAGITIVATTEHAAAVPASLLARCPHRWVMHLNDTHDGAIVGVNAARVPGVGTPGRLVVATTGLVAQLVHETNPLPFGTHDGSRMSQGITTVAPLVDAGDLPAGLAFDGSTSLPLGIDFSSGEAHCFELVEFEHILVVGGARSGRSSALARVAAAWQQARPNGCVAVIDPRGRSTLPTQMSARDTSLLDDLPQSGPLLLLVDDAEMVDDPGGRLAALAAGARSNTCIVAAGRPDALRQLYGHWTTVVRRSRCGVVLTGGSDLDGDLLGVVLPRRIPVPARPGLAWSVSSGIATLTQIALTTRRPVADGRHYVEAHERIS
ncbi:MAG TPA: FtsK/SpoIIIE domain-containing protein [Ilumatobacteraceae bacterium]|nr:FtsK/SpoIIIE domain-containing protein [Ilumatobacteraceae bacterium]